MVKKFDDSYNGFDTSDNTNIGQTDRQTDKWYINIVLPEC